MIRKLKTANEAVKPSRLEDWSIFDNLPDPLPVTDAEIAILELYCTKSSVLSGVCDCQVDDVKMLPPGVRKGSCV